MCSFQVDVAAPVQEGKEVQVLTLKGNLDTSAVPDLEGRISGLIEAGHSLLVISLEEIDYVSSNGLGLLLAAHRRLERQGGRLCLAGVSDEVLHIMEVLGFTQIIRILPDVGAAVAAAADGEVGRSTT